MCELNFEIDTDTKRFLKTNVNRLINVAPERIKTEILKIISLEWNPLVWKTYLELQLFKNWHEDQISSVEIRRKDVLSEELILGSSLAKLICLLSDEALSRLTFSKNQIKRCKNLRLWVHKINKIGLDNLSEDERGQILFQINVKLKSFIFGKII